MRFTTYNLASGQVLMHNEGASADCFVVDDKHALIEGHIPATQYIADGVAVDRSENPTSIDLDTVDADGTTPVTLSDVPEKSVVTVSLGGTVLAGEEVSGGTEEITFDTAGYYTITVSSFPYLEATFNVEAVTP